MSLIHEALYNRLSTFAGITALIGTRSYNSEFPQTGVYPANVFNEILVEHVEDMQGKGGLASTVFQITVLGYNVGVLKRIAEQNRLALQGWNTVFNDLTVYGVNVLDSGDIPKDPDALLFGLMQRFRIWHSEPEPT